MIRVAHLNKTYDRGRAGDRRVLKDVSFVLPEKGFVCILGPSGCGKTSLLNAIGGLDRFDNGTVTAGDTTVSRYGTAAYEAQRNRSFGYIFQNYYLLEDHTVAYNVYLGLHSLELTHSQKMQRVRSALQAVDMDRYLRRKVRDLSGGQQQRVAIARALARRPRVIFADEPTGNLDEANTMNICTLLRQASRESLVIMVTHEERIANFFADRILRLDQGALVADTDSWDRSSLQMGSANEIYAGDLQEQRISGENITLRLLQTPDAMPVELTVVAAKDRIILKLSDERTVSLSSLEERPRIVEGKQPVMTLEALDEGTKGHMRIYDQQPDVQCRAGKGIDLSLMARESLQLLRGKGIKRMGMRVFLVLMAVLTLLTVADFYTVSNVDPQDFIISDSHILIIKIKQGQNTVQDLTQLPTGYSSWIDYQYTLYAQHVAQADTDFDFLPLTSVQAKLDFSVFFQMKHADQTIPGFSYVQADRLREDQLLCGHLPETTQQVVVDRLVLDAFLQKGGIVQNTMQDYTAFLGIELDYGNKGFNPVIVGVSDSGERSIYATQSALYGLSVGGVSVVTLSELRERYPDQYEVLEMHIYKDGEPRYYTLNDLGNDECVVNVAQAGEVWKYRLGQKYGYSPNQKLAVAFLENADLSAKIIVTDAALDQMICNAYNQEIHVWCADKEAMRAYLSEKTQAELDGYISVQITDPYAQKYAEYEAAANQRADGRILITASIVALCMLMLYLLCRSRVNERVGLVAVYRLLGIPGRKLYVIFLMESAIAALTTLLPTVALTWLGITLAGKIPELESTLEMPWQTAAITGVVIICYYLLVSVLPLGRLLRYPPAHLAAKYDL